MPWTRNFAPPIVPRLGVEGVDEGGPDALALDLGVLDARELLEELRGGVDDPKRVVQLAFEHPLDLLALVLTEQAVVDEHAVQPIADRLLDHHRGDRGVDAAREPADDVAGVADLLAHLLHRLVDERRHGPVAVEATELREGAEHLATARGVEDLGVELHAPHPSPPVLDRREGTVPGATDPLEALGERLDVVAVAHPHRLFGSRRERRERTGGRVHVEDRRPVLPLLGGDDGAAKAVDHHIKAVADAEDRHTGVEHSRVELG